MESPDSHTVVVEQPVVESKVKTPDDMRVSSEEETTNIQVFGKECKRPNTKTQASQLAGKILFNTCSTRSEL